LGGRHPQLNKINERKQQMKDSDVSNRISMLRFLMIFGVVIVHTPPNLEVNAMDGSLWAYFTSFLQNAFFRAGVPVLTMISGFLLFSGNSDLKYAKLLKKKAATLLVPFMVFNLGHIALQIALRFATGTWLGEDLFAQDAETWMNSLFSLRKAPENDPLHFLRELIVLAVISPILGVLIRKAPVMGLAAVSLFFLTNSDGYLMNRSDMAIEFYVGGLAAVYQWNLKALDRFAYPALLVFTVASVAVSVFEISNITWLRLMAPVLVWSAASRLVDTPFGKWLARLSMYSFFIYVTHAPLMRICWIVFQKTMPSVPVPVFTAVAPFLFAALCIGIYKVLHFLIPGPLDWALGSRGEKARARPPSATTMEAAKNI
jgi:succinoglycan biosynthesis protein ExoH